MKTILVDGHNLIPKIPGLRLDALDDENQLLVLIQDYSRISRNHVELFFDGASLSDIQVKKYGSVRVHPVRIGLTADDAIIKLLRSKGNNARNPTVVSSDRRVQAEAKALHAAVISSEAFSIEIQKILSSPQAVQEQRERALTESEIEEWEKIFRTKRK